MMLLVYTMAGAPKNFYSLDGLDGVADNSGATRLTIGTTMIDISVTIAQFYEALKTFQGQRNKKHILEITETS